MNKPKISRTKQKVSTMAKNINAIRRSNVTGTLANGKKHTKPHQGYAECERRRNRSWT